MQQSYTLPAKILATYAMTDSESYQRLADKLNNERIIPPRSRQWTKWSARSLCLSIGRPSPRFPKTDLSRLTVNRSLERLIAVLPLLTSGFKTNDLAVASGLSATTCRKYQPLVQAIHDGDIDPVLWSDYFEMWRYWRSVGTNDEEAMPV